MGRDFLGTYDILNDTLLLFGRGDGERVTEPCAAPAWTIRKLAQHLPPLRRSPG